MKLDSGMDVIYEYYQTIDLERTTGGKMFGRMFLFISRNPLFCEPYLFLHYLYLDVERPGEASVVLKKGLRVAQQNIKDVSRLSKVGESQELRLCLQSALRLLEYVEQNYPSLLDTKTRLATKAANYYYQTLSAVQRKNPFEDKRHNLRPLKTYGSATINKIQKEIAQNGHFWIRDTDRQRVLLPHKKTQAIVLRTHNPYDQSGTDKSCGYYYGDARLSEFFPEVMRVTKDFADSINGILARVALVRLQPGAQVGGHFDTEWWYNRSHRYHMPVDIERGSSVITSGSEILSLEEGVLYYFDNLRFHRAFNNSKKHWRTHLIFDVHLR